MKRTGSTGLQAGENVTILTGCSGWSYSDWVGPFYPKELSSRHSEWLHYYSQFFFTTEVNSTFYSMPVEATVNSWIEKTAGLKQFEFSVKLPRSISHELLPSGNIDLAAAEVDCFADVCLTPLRKAERLGAVLLQLPPDFRYSGESLSHLQELLARMTKHGCDVAVEFRDRSWLSAGMEQLRTEAVVTLSSMNCSSVFVDSPAFPATHTLTGDHAYIRFHGRNRDIWYGGAKEEDGRINRYDYLYSRGQLETWIPGVRLLAAEARVVRIYFNNHGRGKAAKNAMEFMDMMGIEHSKKDIRITDQLKLGSF